MLQQKFHKTISSSTQKTQGLRAAMDLVKCKPSSHPKYQKVAAPTQGITLFLYSSTSMVAFLNYFF